MAQRYQKLVEEDLNVGTGDVWITAPGGGQIRSTQVGIHSFSRGLVAHSASWTPGAVAAGLSVTTTLTVPDAITGDYVTASHSKMLTNDLRISGHVSVDGSVEVVIHNPTAASITVPAGTVRVLAFPGFAAANQLIAEFTMVNSSPGDGTVDFTDTSSGGTAPYTYLWEFGDSNTSVDQNPTYQYMQGAENPQTFTVTLTVTDADLVTDSVQHDVTITWVL